MKDLIINLWYKTYIPYWYRRWKLGFDPKDLWSIDFAFFSWLEPRLKAYRKSEWCGIPVGFTWKGKYWGWDEMDADEEGHSKAWFELMDEIIWFLEYMNREQNWPFKDQEEYRRVMRGYGLLMKHLPAMWE